MTLYFYVKNLADSKKVKIFDAEEKDKMYFDGTVKEFLGRKRSLFNAFIYAAYNGPTLIIYVIFSPDSPEGNRMERPKNRVAFVPKKSDEDDDEELRAA